MRRRKERGASLDPLRIAAGARSIKRFRRDGARAILARENHRHLFLSAAFAPGARGLLLSCRPPRRRGADAILGGPHTRPSRWSVRTRITCSSARRSTASPPCSGSTPARRSARSPSARRKHLVSPRCPAHSELPPRLRINGGFNRVAIAHRLRLGALILVDEPMVAIDLSGPAPCRARIPRATARWASSALTFFSRPRPCSIASGRCSR